MNKNTISDKKRLSQEKQELMNEEVQLFVLIHWIIDPCARIQWIQMFVVVNKQSFVVCQKVYFCFLETKVVTFWLPTHSRDRCEFVFFGNKSCNFQKVDWHISSNLWGRSVNNIKFFKYHVSRWKYKTHFLIGQTFLKFYVCSSTFWNSWNQVIYFL